MRNYLEKIKSLYVIFATEIIVVFLASLGLIPREAILFLTGLLIFFIIFSSLEDALWLVIASVPVCVALPLTQTFDTLASWRILIIVMFFCLFFKKGVSLDIIRNSRGKIRIKENLKHYWIEYSAVIFLVVSVGSIFVADFRVLAIKKLLFIVNIFILFLITRNIARVKEKIYFFLEAVAAGGALALAAALAQLAMVLLVPLAIFWQFWTSRVIYVFYGSALADLLSYSNTWFAYYASNPPTLRLFSVFPDSHSFAMFCILLMPALLFLALHYKDCKFKKRLYWALIVLALLGAVLSGSRGAWLGAAPAIVVLGYLYFRKLDAALLKKAAVSFGIFILLFAASFAYPFLLYKFQAWQTGQNVAFSISFFERAKSISDAEEISNKGRLEIWRASLDSLAKQPFFGVGLGNFFKALNEDASAAKKGASAHNLYLDFAVETGIFGALALIAFFANILYASWLVFRRAPDANFRYFGLLFGLYFLWAAAYSFFDVVLLNDKVLLLLMVNLALLYNARNILLDSAKIEK